MDCAAAVADPDREVLRKAMVVLFHDIQPYFRSMIDGLITDFRPQVVDRNKSILSCAVGLVNGQDTVSFIREHVPQATDQNIEDAYLAALAYLVSLMVHDMMAEEKIALDEMPPL